MLAVTGAEYLDGYRIRLSFSDGTTGVVDLTDALWGPVFEPLRERGAFRRFEVSPVFHTVCWENGGDLAPEYLHDLMLEQAAAQPRAIA